LHVSGLSPGVLQQSAVLSQPWPHERHASPAVLAQTPSMQRLLQQLSSYWHGEKSDKQHWLSGPHVQLLQHPVPPGLEQGWRLTPQPVTVFGAHLFGVPGAQLPLEH
jgi:hypothetical protein